MYRVLFRCVPYNSCNAAICYSKPLDTTRLAYIPASEWHREGHTHSIHSTFSIYIAYLLFSLHQYLSPLIYSQFLLHLLWNCTRFCDTCSLFVRMLFSSNYNLSESHCLHKLEIMAGDNENLIKSFKTDLACVTRFSMNWSWRSVWWNCRIDSIRSGFTSSEIPYFFPHRNRLISICVVNLFPFRNENYFTPQQQRQEEQ